MLISLAITVHNEGHYVKTLLEYLTKFVEEKSHLTGHLYKIIVLDDFSDDPLTVSALDNTAFVYQRHLDGDFAAHKNYLNNACQNCDYILQLDADEVIPEDLLFNLPALLEANPEVDAYWLPRVNTVDGLTLQHVRDWHWVITTLPEFVRAKIIDPASEEYRLLKEYDFIISEENGFITYKQPIIQWPDYQCRLYKNIPAIHWEGKVHERLVGFEHYSYFPQQLEFAIQHHKEIKRQEVQNALYDTIKR